MNEQLPHTDMVNDWIVGYLTNSLTPEEMQSLQNWLNVSEENREYFPICKKFGSLLLMRQMNSTSTKNGLINYFRTYGKPCKTIAKTKSIHYQSMDLCCCNGCNCLFLRNDCLSEWKESAPKSIDTDYGGSSIRFKNQIISS